MLDRLSRVRRRDRKVRVAANLGLSAAPSDNFWPVADRAPLTDRRRQTIQEFRDGYDALTDQQAKQFVDDVVKCAEDRLKLTRKYIQEFRTVLPERKGMRYL
jgi:hypothetical protein